MKLRRGGHGWQEGDERQVVPASAIQRLKIGASADANGTAESHTIFQ